MKKLTATEAPTNNIRAAPTNNIRAAIARTRARTRATTRAAASAIATRRMAVYEDFAHFEAGISEFMIIMFIIFLSF